MSTAPHSLVTRTALRLSILVIPLLFVIGSACASAEVKPANPCAFDRAALLALDENSFDQDMDGGWRPLAEHEECREIAADLIRDYRETHKSTSGILYWHEGQLRALAGSVDEAIRLFEQSRRTEDRFGWNLYVDATIAFLKKDKPALLAARETLANLPRPADFDPRDAEGKPVAFSWPMNLNVVDGLVACFGREYREAYGNCQN